MKVSNKSTLLSVLAIATLMSSSMAMAQLRPGNRGEGRGPEQGQQQPGLTPGQVANDDRTNLQRDRDREVQARDEERRQQEEQRAEAERMRRRAEDEQRRRDQADFEARQRQRWFDEQRRLQQEAEAQRQADEWARQQAELAEQARLLEEQRQAMLRQGSANTAFANVTRKAGGEWLRVNLAQAMQLSSIEISVLTAAAKTHQILIHTDNGQTFAIATNPAQVNTITSGAQIKDLRANGIVGRVTAIDIRVESMGAKAVVNVEVNSLEGVPSLSQQRFVAK